MGTEKASSTSTCRRGTELSILLTRISGYTSGPSFDTSYINFNLVLIGFLWVYAGLFLCTLPTFGQSSETRFDSTSVRRVVDSVSRKHVGPSGIPGAAIVVVQDTSILFEKGYGVASAASGRSVSPRHTLFRIGSITKLFTTTAVLQLTESGILNLYADVNRYYRADMVPGRYNQPVTPHQLLTHTSGFDVRFMGTMAYEASDLKPLGTYLRQALPRRVRPPGQIVKYSNHAMTLAGHLAATAADTAYADLIRSRILMPLGMYRSATSLPTLPDSLRSSLARPYHRVSGTLKPHPRTCTIK